MAIKDKHVLYRGTKFEVRCLVLGDKSSPALEFWETLTTVEQQKLFVWLVHLANNGRITNDTKFKKVEGSDVFEFKSHQIRIFCFLHDGTVYLLHGLRKKKDKHNPQDIRRAEEYRRWVLDQ